MLKLRQFIPGCQKWIEGDTTPVVLLGLLELSAIHIVNVHPYDKRLTLCRDMTKLRRAGYGVRLRYVKLVVVVVATQACPATG